MPDSKSPEGGAAIIPFRRRPTNTEVALAISSIPQPKDGRFEALADLPENLLGTNDAFALKVCPPIRIAILVCRMDEAGVEGVVRGLGPEACDELVESWDDTAGWLADLIALMVCAHARFEVVSGSKEQA